MHPLLLNSDSDMETLNSFLLPGAARLSRNGSVLGSWEDEARARGRSCDREIGGLFGYLK